MLDGAFGPNAPHLSSCGGAILLIEALNLVRPNQVTNMHVTTKTKVRVHSYHPPYSCMSSASKNNYHVAGV